MRTFARTAGASVFGARAELVDIQVAFVETEGDGDGSFRIVGLPDSALREGRERIRGAIQHAGWPWRHGHLTVNLAPATARKEGAGLDLPIALASLAVHGMLGPDVDLGGLLCIGELGLDATIRPVRGVLAAVEAARARGIRRAVVPRANAAEGAAVRGVRVVGVERLRQAAGWAVGTRELEATPPPPWEPAPADDAGVRGIRGQDVALRFAAIAATGGHNLLLWGPPGAGKTLIARAVASLLPPLAYEEALEVSRIQSVAGLLPGDGLARRRPFRAPHHTTSLAGLVGGGTWPRPGEVSLAHLGVLFLDELPEFSRPSLEALRQPIEEGRMVLGRAAGRATFPAEVILVAAMNPCPCGFAGDGERCRCTPRDVARYRRRISGPLRDRFDLQVQVQAVDAEALVGPRAELPPDFPDGTRRADAVARQQSRARRLGLRRAANARLPGRLLPAAAEPTPEAERDLVLHARRLGLTGRGVHRVLRVARTVADLEGAVRVEGRHVIEALAAR